MVVVSRSNVYCALFCPSRGAASLISDRRFDVDATRSIGWVTIVHLDLLFASPLTQLLCLFHNHRILVHRLSFVDRRHRVYGTACSASTSSTQNRHHRSRPSTISRSRRHPPWTTPSIWIAYSTSPWRSNDPPHQSSNSRAILHWHVYSNSPDQLHVEYLLSIIISNTGSIDRLRIYRIRNNTNGRWVLWRGLCFMDGRGALLCYLSWTLVVFMFYLIIHHVVLTHHPQTFIIEYYFILLFIQQF